MGVQVIDISPNPVTRLKNTDPIAGLIALHLPSISLRGSIAYIEKSGDKLFYNSLLSGSDQIKDLLFDLFINLILRKCVEQEMQGS